MTIINIGLQSIIESISTYGLPVVISGVIVFLLIIFVKKYFKNLFLTKEKLMEVMIEAEREKKKVDLEEHRKQYNDDIINNSFISERMTEVLYSVNGSRTSIYQYHNTQRLKSGSHFLKFTSTHCKVKRNCSIPDSILLWKDIPSSIISFFNIQLVNKGEFIYNDISELEAVDYSLYHIFNDQNVKSVYAYAMYDDYSNIIGWLAVEFCEQTTLSELEKDIIKDITRSINLHLI